MLGPNPLVSRGSRTIAPRFKDYLVAIAVRGRGIVVDPRHTETARKFEHIAVLPDGDVWLLGAMLRTIAAEQLADIILPDAQCSGWADLSPAIAPLITTQHWSPERVDRFREPRGLRR